MYMKPRPLMYGESLWLIKPFNCFLVRRNVNNLYSKQKAEDIIPPAPTPLTLSFIETYTLKFCKTITFVRIIYNVDYVKETRLNIHRDKN